MLVIGLVAFSERAIAARSIPSRRLDNGLKEARQNGARVFVTGKILLAVNDVA
jgi:hypothetical protein